MYHAYNSSRSSTTLFIGQGTEEEEEEDDKIKSAYSYGTYKAAFFWNFRFTLVLVLAGRRCYSRPGFELFRNDSQAGDSREKNSVVLNLLNISQLLQFIQYTL